MEQQPSIPGSANVRAFFEIAEQAAPDQSEDLLAEASRLLADPAHRFSDDQSVLLLAQGLLLRLELNFPQSEKALSEAERQAEAQGDSVWLARARMHLASHQMLVGDFNRALATAALARPHLAPALLPRLLSNVAAIHQLSEDGPAALGSFADALSSAEAIDDYNAVVTILNNRGSWHNDSGHFANAEVDLRRALLYSSGSVDPFRLASVQHNLGLTLTRQGLVRAGLQEMDQARDLLENRGENDVHTKLDRVESLLRARLLAEARDDIIEVLSQLDEAGMRSSRADGLLLAAKIAVSEGNPQLAVSNAEAAAELFAELDRDLGAQHSSTLLSVLDFDAPLPDHVETDDLSVVEALLLRADHAANPHDAAAAWTIVKERSLATSRDVSLAAYAAARLARHRGDLVDASQQVDRCFAALGQVAADFNSLEIRRRTLTSIVPIEKLATELAVEMQDPDAFGRWLTLGRKTVEGREQSSEGNPQLIAGLEALQALHADGATPTNPETEAHRRRLEERIQMIARAMAPSPSIPSTPVAANGTKLFFGSDDTNLFGLVEGISPIVELGSVETFLDLLDRFEFGISLVARDFPPPGERQVAATRGIATQIDELLIQPLAPWIPSEPLSVTGTGLVAGFPWRLLPTLRDVVISIAQGSSPQPLPDQPRAAVVVGPNVDASHEVEQLRSLHPDCEVLQGSDATVRAVRDLFSRTDLVHVAAHGSLDGDDPLLSSLELADGALTLYDIEALPRIPHTVVLASCRIAGESVRDTGYGLGSVLINGGARQVVATSQPLGERFVPEVLGALHRQLALSGDAGKAVADLSFEDPLVDIAARSLIVLR